MGPEGRLQLLGTTFSDANTNDVLTAPGKEPPFLGVFRSSAPLRSLALGASTLAGAGGSQGRYSNTNPLLSLLSYIARALYELCRPGRPRRP